MKKVDIANYVIFDLANRFNNSNPVGVDNEIVDMVAENWCKKHFVSVPRDVKQHHDEHIRQSFMI